MTILYIGVMSIYKYQTGFRFFWEMSHKNLNPVSCWDSGNKNQFTGFSSMEAVTKSWFINPFVPNAPFLYPLETENRKVHWEQMG